MATYVVGDLQGHLEPLQRLLRRVEFNDARDRLAFVGDVVNRGPNSLEVMRFLYARREHVDVALGNHDVYALARFAGVAKRQDDDTLSVLVAAPEADTLFTWLRQQYLLLEIGDVAVVHAGMPCGWTVEDVRREAASARDVLCSNDFEPMLETYFHSPRVDFSPVLPAIARAAATIRLMTRLRFVDGDGRAMPGSTGPEDPPIGGRPWFTHPARPRGWDRIVFGHWASLGLWVEGDLAAIDTGYTWGGSLTALRLEDSAVFSVPFVRAGKGA